MFESTSRIIYDESPARTFTESGGAPFEATGTVADSTKEFRVMLVWSDPPGSAVTNAPYVNQLNLEVVVGGVVYNGNHFTGQYTTAGGQKDFSNNVQAVRLPAGTTGNCHPGNQIIAVTVCRAFSALDRTSCWSGRD
jgi:hypothetical protein